MTRSDDNQKVLMVMVGGMVLVVLTMIASIFLVTRRPVVVVLPGGGADATQRGTDLPSSVTSENAGTTPAEMKPIEIAVSKVNSAPALDNPLDPQWEKTAVSEIVLQPQQVAQPTLEASTVPKLRVQAVHDERRYVWRLSWDQVQFSQSSNVNEFTNAVAMQFPMVDGAPYTMGGPQMPVTMLYWKAIWQKDVDQGFQDQVVTHPNSHADLYWFASGQSPYRADKSFADPTSRQWLIAASSGNPMADYERTSPLEEMGAHGFGSSTHAKRSPSGARGVWHEGKWFVVIDRPNDSSDKLIARFNQNPKQQLIAFAVWDGTADNRGGKKHITNWTPMRIDP